MTVSAAIVRAGGWKISWSSLSGATRYVVIRETATAPVVSVAAPATSMTFPETVMLESGQTSERFRVRAFSGTSEIGTGVTRLPCADVFFVAARGSGQNLGGDAGDLDYAYGLGSRGFSVYKQLVSRLGVGQSSVRTVPILENYPAVAVDWHVLTDYYPSVSGGVDTSVARIKSIIASCQNQNSRIVTFGYSQGAQVMGDAYQRLAAEGVALSTITKVVLFADPKMRTGDPQVVYPSADPGHNGLLRGRAAMPSDTKPRVQQWCWEGDIVCQGFELGWSFHGPVYDCYEQGAARSLARVFSSTFGLDPNAQAPAPWCFSPRASVGSILTPGDGSSWYIKLILNEVYRLHIPTAATYRCLLALGVSVHSVTQDRLQQIIKHPDEYPACVDPREVRNHVVDVENSATSWYVGTGGTRHWIPDPYTFWCKVDSSLGIARGLTTIDVNTLPRGTDQGRCLSPKRVEGGIVRRTDGVSWVVTSGQRHHMPDYSTDLCAQFRDHRPILVTGITGAQANTLPEGLAYSCNLDHSILRAMDKLDPKPSYAYYSGKRHWIPDQWTYAYLVNQGFRIVNVATEAAIKLLVEGGTEPPKLDPSSIPVNTIIRRSDGVSWVVDGNRVRHHIPYAQDDVCWRDLVGYRVSVTGLTAGQANALAEADRWPCIIGWRIVKSDDGASYVVDGTNTRHWIPDTETYGVLVHQGYQVVGPWPAADVNQIPNGPRRVYMIDAASVSNTIICRDDGICWAVDANGWRHHIPTYGDDVCWRWVYGWHVSRYGLNFEQAASLSEGDPWGCSMDNYIMQTDTGAAYYMWGNTRRWIQDPESYWCYVGRGVRGYISGIGQGAANGVPEGSWMPRCLDPGRVKNHVIRISDGTAYFVDASGWWYWIPDGGVWNCLAPKYGVLIWDATWDEVNALRQERGVWAYCGQ